MTIDYGMDISEESFSTSYSTPQLNLLPEISHGVVWQGCGISYVEWNPSLSIMFSNIVAQAFQSGDPLTYRIPQEVLPHCGSELKRFICAVDGYIQSPNPLLPLKTLVMGLRDRNFAKSLKDLRTALWTRKYNMTSTAPDGLDEVITKFGINPDQFSDLGDIFNAKYWFRWNEDIADDWKHSLIPVEVDDGYPELFKQALRRILPDTCKVVLPDEILLSISSSSCMSNSIPGGKSRVYKEKEKPENNTFSRDPLKGYFTKIYKTPVEVREAISLTVPQSNTVKYIEKQTSVLMSKISTSNYGFSKEEFKENLEDLWDNNFCFLNRDLTKEGWTKPRWILLAMGEVLEEKYPECKAFSYIKDIYRKFDLVKDGVTIPTLRGHGLGMANALTTLMQCTVFEMVCFERGEMINEPSALFYNDDGTIGAESEDDIIAYTEHEDSILMGLGLLKKDKKTYWGPVSVLCECYSNSDLNRKASYCKYIRRIPFSASCVLEAKVKAYMTVDPTFGEVELGLFEKLISFFGCEYSIDEYKLPYWAGGFRRNFYKGVDLTFFDVGDHDPQLLARGFSVGPPEQKPLLFSPKIKGNYVNPIEYIYPCKDVDPVVHKALGIFQPRRAIEAKLNRSFDRHAHESWWIHEMNVRHKRWNTPSKELSICGYHKSWVAQHPWADSIPPQNNFRERPLDDFSKYCPHKARPDLPDQPNRILGSLSAFTNFGKYIKYCIPIPYIPGRNSGRSEISDERLDKFNESVLNIPGYTQLAIVKPRDLLYTCLTKRCYNNDYDVIEAFATITGKTNVYPEPRFLSVGGEISKKFAFTFHTLEFYGIPLYFEWWCGPMGRTIPVALMTNLLTVDEVLEITNLKEKDEAPEPTPGSWDSSITFSEWRFNKTLNPHPGKLAIYILVDNLLMNSDILYQSPELISREESRLNIEKSQKPEETLDEGLHRLLEVAGRDVPEEGSPPDTVYKNTTGVIGVKVFGVYHYRPPDIDVFGGSQSGESDQGGLFDSLW